MFLETTIRTRTRIADDSFPKIWLQLSSSESSRDQERPLAPIFEEQIPPSIFEITTRTMSSSHHLRPLSADEGAPPAHSSSESCPSSGTAQSSSKKNSVFQGCPSSYEENFRDAKNSVFQGCPSSYEENFRDAKDRDLAAGAGWPLPLFAEKPARIFHDPLEFVDELLTGQYICDPRINI